MVQSYILTILHNYSKENFVSSFTPQVQSYNSHQLQQHLDSFLRRGSKNYTQLRNSPQTSFSSYFPSPLTSLLPRTGIPKHCCQERIFYMYFIFTFYRGSWFHSIPFHPFKFQGNLLSLSLVFHSLTLETLYSKFTHAGILCFPKQARHFKKCIRL